MLAILTATRQAWQDYGYWQDNDKQTLNRINTLIHDIRRTPYSGIGKPIALKGDLEGFWSRRIDTTNRLIYTVEQNKLIIIACRYHFC